MQTLQDLLKDKGVEVYKEKSNFKGNQYSASLSIVDNGPKHNTREMIAEKLGWSTGKKAQFDIVAKKAPEEVKAQLRTGEISINQAYKDIKKEEKATLLVGRKEREIQESTEIKPKIDEYNVQLGQVWKLGRHTLICGSVYDSVITKATAIITDPPYGIDYKAAGKNGMEV